MSTRTSTSTRAPSRKGEGKASRARYRTIPSKERFLTFRRERPRGLQGRGHGFVQQAAPARSSSGEIIEIDPPRRLVLKWRNEFRPVAKVDGYTRCTFAIEREGEVVKLTVTHEADRPHMLIEAVSLAGRAPCRASRACSKPARGCRGQMRCHEDENHKARFSGAKHTKSL